MLQMGEQMSTETSEWRQPEDGNKSVHSYQQGEWKSRATRTKQQQKKEYNLVTGDWNLAYIFYLSIFMVELI
jgi:hypothetical protein